MDRLETLFAGLIVLQFLLVAFHDLIDIPGLTRGAQVKSVVGGRTLLLVTVINAIFPAAAVALVAVYWQSPKPAFVTDYWLAYTGVTVLLAILMWYVPYLFGASAKTRQAYQDMYAGTWQVLPKRNDNPRPNLLHVAFHVLFLATLALAIGLKLRPG